MTYLPPPKGSFDVEWATQNNRIIQQELGRLQPLQVRVADLESGKQPLDGDLTAIAALTGTGYIRRTADDTWAISATIPNTSVTGLGTMSTQNATAVAITGGTATLSTVTTGHVQVTGGSFGAGRLYKSASHGTALVASAGSSYDAALFNPAGSAAIWRVPTGTNNVEFGGTLTTTGNVGIGLAIPAASLHVRDSANITTSTPATSDAAVIVTDAGNSVGSGGLMLWGANNGSFAGIKGRLTSGSNNTAGDLAFYTRNASTDATLTERIRLLANGNLGIGTTSPGEKLTVNGNISASNLAGTTYTPTLRSTVDVNISSSTFQSASYIRVGSAVMATIQLFITPSASGSVRFSVTLPVSSNFTTNYQLGGTCAARDTVPLTGIVIGSATNDNAVAEFVAATTNAHEVTLQIIYPIL